VTSHSLQPYRGCTFGNALCGVGCYVQHNRHLLAGRRWGGFLEVRTNAAESYREHYEREARWARRTTSPEGETATSGATGGLSASASDQTTAISARSSRAELSTNMPALLRDAGMAPCEPKPRPGKFSIFLSSATDPFVPQEFRCGVTRSVLETMLELPPDELVLQTHSPRVVDYLELYRALSARCDLRVHLSIETDREDMPGLPPHAASVARRLEACAVLKRAGVRTVVTVSPLLPIEHPRLFFERIAAVADAVVIDHFIEGDGSRDGSRTARTSLPEAMRRLDPESIGLEYRERMAEVARQVLPGRVGISIRGFAGQYC
jgi:DNA repair photolyase